MCRLGGISVGIEALSSQVQSQSVDLSEAVRGINGSVDTMVDAGLACCKQFVAKGSAQYDALKTQVCKVPMVMQYIPLHVVWPNVCAARQAFECILCT